MKEKRSTVIKRPAVGGTLCSLECSLGVVLTPLLIVRDKSLKVGVQSCEFAWDVVRNDACS